jgi:pSer/pThr/pTyr-binding forkhead associated (FHA) protein
VPRLVVEKGKDKGKNLRIKENGVFLVGRDMKTNLKVSDAQCSRRHFKLTCRLGEYRIEDLDSSNGTFVNGRRIRSTMLT